MQIAKRADELERQAANAANKMLREENNKSSTRPTLVLARTGFAP